MITNKITLRSSSKPKFPHDSVANTQTVSAWVLFFWLIQNLKSSNRFQNKPAHTRNSEPDICQKGPESIGCACKSFIYPSFPVDELFIPDWTKMSFRLTWKDMKMLLLHALKCLDTCTVKLLWCTGTQLSAGFQQASSLKNAVSCLSSDMVKIWSTSVNNISYVARTWQTKMIMYFAKVKRCK